MEDKHTTLLEIQRQIIEDSGCYSSIAIFLSMVLLIIMLVMIIVSLIIERVF